MADTRKPGVLIPSHSRGDKYLHEIHFLENREMNFYWKILLDVSGLGLPSSRDRDQIISFDGCPDFDLALMRCKATDVQNVAE